MFYLHKGTPLGYTDPSSYLMQRSKCLRNGVFLGLPLDSHNQPALTLPRIQEWCRQLQFELQELQLEQGLQQMQQQIHELQEVQLQRDLAGQTGGFTFRSSREEQTTRSLYEGGSSSSSSISTGSWRRSAAATTTTTESNIDSMDSNDLFNGTWRGGWREEIGNGSSSSSSSRQSPVLWRPPQDTTHAAAPAAGPMEPEKPLYIPDTPAAWARDGIFMEEYPKGFIFTDRWYKLGDRWYRFADEGFVVTAGFREHTAYPYAYRDIVQVEQLIPQQQEQLLEEGLDVEEEMVADRCSRGVSGGTGVETVELWVTVRVPLPLGITVSRSGNGGACVQKTLILKDVEVCDKDYGVCPIMKFLKMKMAESAAAGTGEQLRGES